jgi:hypothetical protein
MELSLANCKAEQNYRLQVTTLAVHWSEGKGQPVRIPAGAILSNFRAPEADSRFVEVVWNSRPFTMFAEDFQERVQRASY